MEACLFLYSCGEIDNIATSFLQCGISPYIPRWLIAELAGVDRQTYKEAQDDHDESVISE
jgi:hypothetical protein